jgi:hypothetical protein
MAEFQSRKKSYTVRPTLSWLRANKQTYTDIRPTVDNAPISVHGVRRNNVVKDLEALKPFPRHTRCRIERATIVVSTPSTLLNYAECGWASNTARYVFERPEVDASFRRGCLCSSLGEIRKSACFNPTEYLDFASWFHAFQYPNLKTISGERFSTINDGTLHLGITFVDFL